LSVFDHCLPQPELCERGGGGKTRPAPVADHEEAVVHCTKELASGAGPANDQDAAEPDVVMACCGDTPTLEILAPFPFFASICLT